MSDESEYARDYTEGLEEHVDLSYTADADIITRLYGSPSGRLRRRNPPIQHMNPYIDTKGFESGGHYDLKALALQYITHDFKTIADYNNQKGNTTMDLNEKTEMLQRQMNVILKQLAALNRFPKEDPCNDGDIIAFSRKFPGNDQTWYYAAIRIEGTYYLTGGKSNPQGYTWSDLIGWMSSHVDSITLMGPGRELMHVPTAAEPPAPMTDEEYSKTAQNISREYINRPRAIYDDPQA